jgi:hypothetical protein
VRGTVHALSLPITIPAELCRDHDLVAERRNAVTEDPFDLLRAGSLGRIVNVTPHSKAVRMNVDHLRLGGDRTCGSCSARQGVPKVLVLEVSDKLEPVSCRSDVPQAVAQRVRAALGSRVLSVSRVGHIFHACQLTAFRYSLTMSRRRTIRSSKARRLCKY